jgi:hypothetical protein
MSFATFAAIETQAHTFQSCEVPQFEWAAYGNRVTGRMYGMTAAVNDNHVFAAGYLKSTLDPEAADFEDISNDYAVTGPYTSTDWDGSSAQTITVDLKSYPSSGGAAENAGGSWRAYEAGVVKIDKTTGVPVGHPHAVAPPTARRPPPTANRPPPTAHCPLLAHTAHHPPPLCQANVYVYYGEGMDETTGLAAVGDVLAISGHFAGNLPNPYPYPYPNPYPALALALTLTLTHP